MKITKPKKDYGYYCDLCKQKICKYSLDWNQSGAINIMRAFKVTANKQSVIDHKEFEVCYDCAKEIAEGVVDGY